MEILSGNLSSVESSVWNPPSARGEGRGKTGMEMEMMEMEEQQEG
jgi:hypothetical protein